MKKLFLIVALLTVLVNGVSYAQSLKEYEISGIVMDSDGDPVPGVTVSVKGMQYATITDGDGKYVLKAKVEGRFSIEYTCIGLKTVLVKYDGNNVIDVVMEYDNTVLDAVVVSARQNINELDIRAKSGVVQQVDMSRIVTKPTIDISSALQGSVPGLIVTNTGALGSKPEIRIRGNSSLRKGSSANEPLYVMDGQVISSDVFFELNPNDIADIKVLKDAAACALYGVKAANGVIEITSQRGNAGPMSVTYNMDMGVTTRGRRGIAMMNSTEKLELERLLQNTATPGYRYSEDFFRKYYPTDPDLENMIAEGREVLDSLRAINTDWFKELIRMSMYQKHNLSLKGGNDKTVYYLSANFTQQGGRIPGNDKYRTSMRLNLDQKISDWGYAMFSVSGGYSKTNSPIGTEYDPTMLVYELNPYERPDVGELWSYPNRTYQDLLNQYSSESEDKTAGASASINLNFVPGLDISAVAGLDFSLSESLNVVPSTAYSEQNSGVPENQRGYLTKSKNTSTNITSNIRITYSNTFNEKHNLTVGGNYDYYMSLMDNVSITGYGIGKLKNPSAINQSIEGNRKPRVGSFREKSAQMGIGLLFGYTYNEIYDIFGTYKADASSLLPQDKRWNSAWAAGAGWTISNYAFLKNNSVLTNLNLKASYGVTASLAGVSAASTIGTFMYSQNSYEDQRLLEFLGIYNSDLKPEKTTSIDVGLSVGLFKRWDLNLNLYKRRTTDALLDVPIPSSNGYGYLKRNIGILDNNGIEFSTSVRVIDKHELYMIIGGSIAYNNNMVVDLYDADRIYASENSVIPDYEVGKSVDMLYGPHSLGINPVTGLPVFLGSDGREIQATETLLREDMVALGYMVPPFSGALNFSFTYKSFDFNADFYYVFGGVKQYDQSYVRDQNSANKNAIKNQISDMWFKKGDEGKTYHTPFYSSAAIDNLTLYPNTLTVGSSDYIKLSMISLRYRLSSAFLEKNLKFIKYANVAFQASNLFTLSRYKESNPEGGTLAGSQQPVLTINLSVTF